MFIIKRRGKVVGGAHRIYTLSEARAKKLDIADDWRKAEAGQWVLTDDGWVGQVIKHQDYYDRVRSKPGKPHYTRFLLFGFGRINSNFKHLDLRTRMVNMWSISGKPWYQEFLKNARGKMFVMAYCKMMFSEGKVDLKILGNIIGSGKNPQTRARIYLKNPKIQKELAEAMEQLLNKKGITRESVVDDLLDIKEQALKNGKYKEALEVVSKFEKYFGMEPDGFGTPPGSTGEQNQIADRFNEFANSLPEASAHDNVLEDDKLLLGKMAYNKPEILDSEGFSVKEIGRGDEVENKKEGEVK